MHKATEPQQQPAQYVKGVLAKQNHKCLPEGNLGCCLGNSTPIQQPQMWLVCVMQVNIKMQVVLGSKISP